MTALRLIEDTLYEMCSAIAGLFPQDRDYPTARELFR
jgi:hypothetical protein